MLVVEVVVMALSFAPQWLGLSAKSGDCAMTDHNAGDQLLLRLVAPDKPAVVRYDAFFRVGASVQQRSKGLHTVKRPETALAGRIGGRGLDDLLSLARMHL